MGEDTIGFVRNVEVIASASCPATVQIHWKLANVFPEKQLFRNLGGKIFYSSHSGGFEAYQLVE